MSRKLSGILKSALAWLRRLCGACDGGAPERPASGRPDAAPGALPPALLRIRRVLDSSGIRQRRGGEPGVWVARAEEFSGACRFMLRLCAPRHIRCIRQAGHIRYKALLPDGGGSMLLSDRVGNRKNTVAVMIFAVGQLPEIREIRFSPRKRGRRP